jgi:hypothetical protein
MTALTGPVIAEPYAFIGAGSINSNGAVGIGTGLQLNRNIGLEAAYWKPSTFSESNSFSGSTSTSTTVEGNIWTLSGVARLPIGQWNLLAKLSANYVKANFREHTITTRDVQTPSGPIPVLVSDTTVTRASKDWVGGGGLGVEYTFDKSVSARALWEYVGRTTELGKMNQFSIQGLYRF